MKFINQYSLILFTAVVIIAMASCKSQGDYPGTDYMPDMGPSIAYEANYYIDADDSYLKYSQRKTSTPGEYQKYTRTRKPVEGTVPRGYAGFAGKNANEAALLSQDMVDKPLNGFVPYYFPYTEEGKAAAEAAYSSNPFPLTKSGVASGKNLYNINCAVCHGDKLDGNGVIVENGAYPNQPANFLSEDFINRSEGLYYHTIMHGKGVMSGYSDRLSEEERWQVIHYIKSVQAKELGVDYMANALDANAIDFSAALKELAASKTDTSASKTLVLNNVFFNTGSAFLKPSSKYQLDKLASALRANPSLKVEISGHTDNTGNTDSNNILSTERANAVTNYLVINGVSAANLVSKGYGSSEPRDTNATEEGRQANRRTEFKLL